MLGTDVHSTGSFDLRSLETTSFGKLLDAVPLPVLLIDQWHLVVFVNQACQRICLGRSIVGSSFEDLVPTPTDANRARTLTDKAASLVEQAFSTRKPQTSEAILQFGKEKKWCRLHLRSVRMASQRHILTAIEDLTYEKAHQRISRRQGEQLIIEYEKLKTRHSQLIEKYKLQQDRLVHETSLRHVIEDHLNIERERFQAIGRVVPSGLAIADGNGSVKYCNEPFKELFGEEPENLVSHQEGERSSETQSRQQQIERSIWHEALSVDQRGISQTMFFTVTNEDGKVARVHVVTLKLSNGDYLVTCHYV